MGESTWAASPPFPAVAPLSTGRGAAVSGTGYNWRHFDDSVNAVSFGFVATAILISMFLFMAIFERFLRRAPSPDGGQSRRLRDFDAQTRLTQKLDSSSDPKVMVAAREIAVLMPGEELPTFVALPAPMPCPPERISWPIDQHIRSHSSILAQPEA